MNLFIEYYNTLARHIGILIIYSFPLILFILIGILNKKDDGNSLTPSIYGCLSIIFWAIFVHVLAFWIIGWNSELFKNAITNHSNKVGNFTLVTILLFLIYRDYKKDK